jgi:hypothetical protein
MLTHISVRYSVTLLQLQTLLRVITINVSKNWEGGGRGVFKIANPAFAMRI